MKIIVANIFESEHQAFSDEQIKKEIRLIIDDIPKCDKVLFVEQSNNLAFRAMSQFKEAADELKGLHFTPWLNPSEQYFRAALWLERQVLEFRETVNVSQPELVFIILGEYKFAFSVVSTMVTATRLKKNYGTMFHIDSHSFRDSHLNEYKKSLLKSFQEHAEFPEQYKAVLEDLGIDENDTHDKQYSQLEDGLRLS